MGVYRTRHLRRATLLAYLGDAVLGVAIGIPLSIVVWLLALYALAEWP